MIVGFMKKIIFALLLICTSTSVFADIGLFFDGTDRYARNGVIQSSFPSVPLVSCPSYKACNSYLPTNFYVSIIYSDIAKLTLEFKRRAKTIVSAKFIHTVRGNGFKINVHDIVDVEGRKLVALGVVTAKKKTTNKLNLVIAQTLANEMQLAYSRAGLSPVI